MELLIVFVIICLMANAMRVHKRKNNQATIGIYHRERLLTLNESKYFETVDTVGQKFQLRTFSKVRLLDIVKPNHSKNMAAMNKVIRKHVDFLLCDKNFMPICVIEIDDSSHNTADARHRDAVKDAALKDAGVPILRRRFITAIELERALLEILSPIETQHNQTEEQANKRAASGPEGA